MNMDETKLYSWFLGPKAENADMLEHLVLEALRDCVFWRRNFHPEDDIIITEKVKREDAFQDSQALVRQEFLALLANLKRDIPFYSPRYIGHMLGDQLLPAIAAYFAAMLHNPNNVTLEASPITTRYEMEVARQLAGLMGYSGETWGHITSGGTLANFEALWVARNLKYFPIAARDAARALALEELPVTRPTGETINLVTSEDNWPLLNLDTDEALNLRSRLYTAYARRRSDLPQDESKKQVDRLLSAYGISGKGIQRFFSELGDEKVAAPLALVPATAHYSMQKVVEALGLGKEQIKMIPVDGHFRTDVGALREILMRCAIERRPVLALVSVLGSTEEGAIDQIHRLVELQAEMRKQGLAFYHHCDAAWGGYIRTLFFDGQGRPVKTPSAIREITQTWPSDEVFQSFSAVHHADSVTVDPHKLGYVPYSCGFSGAESGNVRIGDAVVVFAQGPIGLCATAGAKLMGAALIIGVDSDENRLSMSRRLGADVTLNHLEVDVVEEVKRLTGGGADVAIEALGTQGTFENALRCLRPGGVLSSLGVYSGKLGVPYDAFAAGIGDYRIVTTLCPGGKERMRRLMEVVKGRRVDFTPLLTHTFSLDEIEEGYRVFGERIDGALKVAIKPL